MYIIVSNGIHSVINHNDMKPHARASRRITNQDSQRRRRLDPERREEENKQRRTRREEPGVIEHESIQRAVARLDPVRREGEQATGCKILPYCEQLNYYMNSMAT